METIASPVVCGMHRLGSCPGGWAERMVSQLPLGVH